MKIITKTISIDELKSLSEKMFGKIVKAVIDIDREIMAIDAELHVDLEELLLDNESKQDNLWGINFHPSKFPNTDWIEFDSMINVRPVRRNISRYVENEQTRKQILNTINKLIQT